VQESDLGGLGLLHLEDQVGALPDDRGGRNDPRARGAISLVRDIAAKAGAPLHHRDMAVATKRRDSRRRQRDAILLSLDLGGNADDHPVCLLQVVGSLNRTSQRGNIFNPRAPAPADITDKTRRCHHQHQRATTSVCAIVKRSLLSVRICTKMVDGHLTSVMSPSLDEHGVIMARVPGRAGSVAT